MIGVREAVLFLGLFMGALVGGTFSDRLPVVGCIGGAIGGGLVGLFAAALFSLLVELIDDCERAARKTNPKQARLFSVLSFIVVMMGLAVVIGVLILELIHIKSMRK
jgi:cell division protein FtsX